MFIIAHPVHPPPGDLAPLQHGGGLGLLLHGLPGGRQGAHLHYRWRRVPPRNTVTNPPPAPLPTFLQFQSHTTNFHLLLLPLPSPRSAPLSPEHTHSPQLPRKCTRPVRGCEVQGLLHTAGGGEQGELPDGLGPGRSSMQHLYFHDPGVRQGHGHRHHQQGDGRQVRPHTWYTMCTQPRGGVRPCGLPRLGGRPGRGGRWRGLPAV